MPRDQPRLGRVKARRWGRWRARERVKPRRRLKLRTISDGGGGGRWPITGRRRPDTPELVLRGVKLFAGHQRCQPGVLRGHPRLCRRRVCTSSRYGRRGRGHTGGRVVSLLWRFVPSDENAMHCARLHLLDGFFCARVALVNQEWLCPQPRGTLGGVSGPARSAWRRRWRRKLGLPNERVLTWILKWGEYRLRHSRESATLMQLWGGKTLEDGLLVDVRGRGKPGRGERRGVWQSFVHV